MQNLNPDTINGIIIFVGALTALLGGGGLWFGMWAVIQVLKARKDDLERAFLSADPKTQAVLLGIATQFNEFTKVFTELATLLKDTTDGKPNTTDPITSTTASMNEIADFPHATFSRDKIDALKIASARVNDTLARLDAYRDSPSG